MLHQQKHENGLLKKMKKLLIITYYWPPSGGGGVQRWLKFAKYLPEFGWEPIIYTPENPQFENKDSSLLKEIGESTRIIKTPIKEPYNLFKKFFFRSNRTLKQGVVDDKASNTVSNYLASWIRGNIFIPDPRVSWVKPSVQFLSQWLESEHIEGIITTGPPHSMHLIGYNLKKKFNHVKWIADFRDPWTDWDILDKFHLTKKSREVHGRMEKDVVTTADKIITVSESWAEIFRTRYSKEIDVVTNGYDEDDLPNVDQPHKKEFRILHAGLLNDLRNPPALWQVLENILSNNSNFRNSFKLVFAGNVSSAIINEIKTYALLKDHFEYLGYLNHSKLMMEYKKASVLLLIQNKSNMSKGHLPGKFFEYLGTGIPVMALGQHESDLAKLVRDYSQLPFCDPENAVEINACVTQSFEAFRLGKKLEPLKLPEVFSRKNLTVKLAKLLNEL